MLTDDEGSVRSLLRAVPVPPSRVELESLLVSGRRRVRHRRAGKVATLAALTGAVLVVTAIVATPLHRNGSSRTADRRVDQSAGADRGGPHLAPDGSVRPQLPGHPARRPGRVDRRRGDDR